jgi:hypothetical protein
VSRGNAYKDKGDVDHAISDYSEAIRLINQYISKRTFLDMVTRI